MQCSGNGSGLFAASGVPYGNCLIRVLRADKVNNLKSCTITFNMHLISTTATPKISKPYKYKPSKIYKPSRISCMISGGKPVVTW